MNLGEHEKTYIATPESDPVPSYEEIPESAPAERPVEQEPDLVPA